MSGERQRPIVRVVPRQPMPWLERATIGKYDEPNDELGDEDLAEYRSRFRRDHDSD